MSLITALCFLISDDYPFAPAALVQPYGPCHCDRSIFYKEQRVRLYRYATQYTRATFIACYVHVCLVKAHHGASVSSHGFSRDVVLQVPHANELVLNIFFYFYFFLIIGDLFSDFYCQFKCFFPK